MNGPGAERDFEPECQRAADGGDADEEQAAVNVGDATHCELVRLTRRPAAAWIAARMRW